MPILSIRTVRHHQIVFAKSQSHASLAIGTKFLDLGDASISDQSVSVRERPEGSLRVSVDWIIGVLEILQNSGSLFVQIQVQLQARRGGRVVPVGVVVVEPVNLDG